MITGDKRAKPMRTFMNRYSVVFDYEDVPAVTDVSDVTDV